MASFLHGVGRVLWINIPQIRDYIILGKRHRPRSHALRYLDKMWLVKAFQSILGLSQTWDSCIVPSVAMSMIWKRYSEEDRKLIFSVFRFYDVCFSIEYHASTLLITF